MTKIILNVLKQTPGAFSAAALLIANSALANQVSVEQLANAQNINTNTTTQLPAEPQNNTTSEDVVSGDSRLQKLQDPSLKTPGAELEQADPMGQVTSVSQLSDVRPTDWAFQALQSLVERYGCIAGYPDGTYKGNRAMTRYEFAAGLNACLERVTELIALATADLVTRDDLAVLQRLQEEFAVELAELRGRVDALEARTAELEANQFSTTTKLNGEVLFWVTDTWGERAEARGEPQSENDRTEAALGYRVRLNFDTSFMGKDRLRARLQARDIPNWSARDLTNTLMTRLGTDESDPDDTVVLDKLFYQFPVGDQLQVIIGPQGVEVDDFQTVLSPFESSGSGATSRFGRYNPTAYRGPDDGGLIVQYKPAKQWQINAGYLAGEPENPREGNGLFNGEHSAFGQVAFEPNSKLAFTVNYVRKYFIKDEVNVTSSTGSFRARDPFDGRRTTADNIGLEAQWRLNDHVQIGGWFGTTWARPEDGNNDDDDDITIINGALTIAFPDLFKDGSLGGIIVGVPPIITDGGNDDNLKDPDTSVHVEIFYRYAINDFIAITPGLFVITNPNHDEDNETLWVGSLRTTFKF
ncbi:MAG: iron uptake porin [Trichodesmium sp. St16_bin4-tuft]|nr:iron uptake porin [Trichodesmium sp. ALOHA_ZT_67]MDE5068223.1 iron uptake porin [Trichodesmium sp. St4_bin8_1]MDE5074041.1 iron uptake porin [Trichodesmium sp. St5_bin8]MDE5077822.1 iron uptake porin [Trichodesmium sp. St2_bin6]MDE5094834.1 iron uptake porin [Trichodesmium sp. St11_bin5]MDE5098289.1 iron uptake porin [Trichodesmium sp. St16_bin4-tuft]MDE5104221.1 iron uptake porin [Trichodesmium sp. St19_bin2]